MTLEEYIDALDAPRGAWQDELSAYELADRLRADGYRVVKLENATQFVGDYHFVTEELTIGGSPDRYYESPTARGPDM